MSKILKVVGGSPIFIADTGVTLPASPATFTIDPMDYWLWAASSNIVTQVGSGAVIVNDGSFDLSISNGIDLIKGIFPTTVITSQTAGTDASASTNQGSITDGMAAIANNTWVLIYQGNFTSGYFHIAGWNYFSDKNTVFQMTLHNNAAPTRANITEIIGTRTSTNQKQDDAVAYQRAKTRAGGANIKLCIWAKSLNGNGVAAVDTNVFTTT